MDTTPQRCSLSAQSENPGAAWKVGCWLFYCEKSVNEPKSPWLTKAWVRNVEPPALIELSLNRQVKGFSPCQWFVLLSSYNKCHFFFKSRKSSKISASLNINKSKQNHKGIALTFLKSSHGTKLLLITIELFPFSSQPRFWNKNQDVYVWSRKIQ